MVNHIFKHVMGQFYELKVLNLDLLKALMYVEYLVSFCLCHSDSLFHVAISKKKVKCIEKNRSNGVRSPYRMWTVSKPASLVSLLNVFFH